MQMPGISYLVAILVLSLSLALYLLQRRVNRYRKTLKWVGAVPGYPILGNALDFGDSTKTLDAMHNYLIKHDGQCYIELLGRPIILISDYKFTEWLLSSATLLTKSRDYQFLYNWLQGGLLISPGNAEWKKSRKILTPSFHFGILEKFVDSFEESTAVLLQKLEQQVGKDSIDIHPMITLYTLDTICRTSMGVQLNVQEGDHADYVDAVGGMCKMVVDRAFSPLKMIDFFYYLSYQHYQETKYVKLLHDMSDTVIEKRRKEIESQDEKDQGDDLGRKRKMAFLDILLRYRDEKGQALSHDFIRHEVDTFLFAGHDTTASAISFAIYCLANHPEVQQQAYNEIQQILGNEATVTYQNIQEMKYLELVVKETLRLFPSVPFYSRQITEDVVYQAGQVIPKGVTLLINAYTINRDPKVYENPEKFIPTRFLDKNIKPFSYVPFSAGPRNCIGQKFAMLEMKYLLAKVLMNFELLPSVPNKEPILAAETVLKSTNGLNIRLKKRSQTE